MIFSDLPEYQRDVKALSKKYRSLEDDLVILRKVLAVRPDESPPFSHKIAGLGIQTCVIKVKKIACKSLKGRGANSGLRFIYAYFPNKSKIVSIELYHKNSKELEDRSRVLKNFS